MSTKKPGKGRRRIKVAGQEVREDQNKSAGFAEAFKLDDTQSDAEDVDPEKSAYHPSHLDKFIMGQMTLGDLEGVTKQQQYEIAQVGHGYLSSGKLEEARKIFEGLLALDPYDAYFHTCIGSIAQQEEKYEEAEAAYTKALSINPYSATAYANRGEIRVMTGNLAEGALDLVRAVKEDPEGKEDSVIRAKATIQVLREELDAVDVDQLEAKARAASQSKAGASKRIAKKIRSKKPKARAPAGKKK